MYARVCPNLSNVAKSSCLACRICSIVENLLTMVFAALWPIVGIDSAGRILSSGSVLLFSMCFMMCLAVFSPTMLWVPFLLVPVVAFASVFSLIS